MKERHLLRPSKRLKKQQEAAQARQQQANLKNEQVNSRSSFSDNDPSSAIKLKSALIGNKDQDQPNFNNSIEMSSLFKQTLFQTASNSVANLQQQPNLASTPSNSVASDLLKKLQDFKDSNHF